MELKEIKLGALALATLTMAASCSLDEDFRNLETVNSNNDDTEIGFKVQTGSLTRAASSYSNNSRPSQFKITAFDGDTNFYGGRADIVTSADNGNTWVSDRQRYWPTDRGDNWEGLNFYAYIDGNDNSRSESFPETFDFSGDVPMIANFEVDPDISKQRDLMYAVAKNVSKKSNNGHVSLSFRHALSQICFTAQNCNPTLDDIEILSVELGGVKGKGTFVFPDSQADGGLIMVLSDGPSEGWNIDYDAPDCSYTLSDINMHLGSALPTGKGDVMNINIPTDGSDCASAMFLLPQTAKPRISSSDDSGAYLKVTVRKTLAGKTAPEAEEVVYIPTSVSWQEGHRYIYNITWKASLISFSVTVDSFTDA